MSATVTRRDPTKEVAEEFWGADVSPEHWDAIQRHAGPGDCILDLGTGRGALVRALQASNYVAVGCDRLVFDDWRDAGFFVRGDGTKLPFRDDVFDFTVAFEVLEHCPDYERMLSEIARCTRQKLILSVPDCQLKNRLRDHNLVPAHWSDPTHCNFFVEESLRDALGSAGFRVRELARCVPISPNDYFWNTLRVPRFLANFGRSVCRRMRLVETYWSSLIVVAEVPT